MSTRTDRVSDLIKGEVSRLIQREVKDPRVGFVTVTGAAVTADLRSVRVFVSVLGEAPARAAALDALNHAAGFFRRSLFKNLSLRHSPAVAFVLDESLERGARIEEVLREIHSGDAAGQVGESGADEEE